MYTGLILRVGETSPIAKVNLARTNFGYDEEDVIVILRNNKPVEIQTIDGAQITLGLDAEDTLEDCLTALLAVRNAPPVEEPTLP